MTDGLVGYTGFVGSNLTLQHEFGGLFNRANVADLAGATFDRLVVSAVPATMWLANRNPKADRAGILELFEHLRGARARVVVVVSTIAVYRDPSSGVDETSDDFEAVRAYGRHRREFEALVEETFTRSLLLRLPALSGRGLKKNFLFDLMNPVPSYLSADLYSRLRDGAGSGNLPLLEAAFGWDSAATMWKFDRDRFSDGPEAARLNELCAQAGISALAFTNADSSFQFYDLSRLWSDVTRALEDGIGVLNLATEPVTAGEVHDALLGRPMHYRTADLVKQDMRTRHSGLWGRSDGYIAGREEVISSIRDLVGDRA